MRKPMRHWAGTMCPGIQTPRVYDWLPENEPWSVDGLWFTPTETIIGKRYGNVKPCLIEAVDVQK